MTNVVKMDDCPVTTPATGKPLARYGAHLLDRAYMSGVERDEARVKATAEVFTPDEMVLTLVERTGLETICDPKKRIIDPACGDGQFLAHILHLRLQAKVPLLPALRTLHGIDIMEDNVKLCQERLMCGHHRNAKVREVVERNIVCADACKYHMRFDGSPVTDQIDMDLESKDTA